jgi:hypothetical protein
MNRGLFRFVAYVFALGFVGSAAAHHPPKMDNCASYSFTGQIERIEWRAPHVELFIRTKEGVSRRVSWLAVNQLALAGIEEDTLRIGDQVDVTAGVLLEDTTTRPMLLSYIHRETDGWGWSQKPQGC